MESHCRGERHRGTLVCRQREAFALVVFSHSDRESGRPMILVRRQSLIVSARAPARWPRPDERPRVWLPPRGLSLGTNLLPPGFSAPPLVYFRRKAIVFDAAQARGSNVSELPSQPQAGRGMNRRVLWALTGTLIVLLERGLAALDFIRDHSRRNERGGRGTKSPRLCDD
jgi:hypothetical protein